MTVALLLLAAAAVAVLALWLRSNDALKRRAPKPGEDLGRHNAPDDGEMVLLRVLVAEEAHVVRGLLETSGVPVRMVPAHPDDMMAAYMRTPPRHYRLLVPPARVAEAEALIAP